MSEEDLKNFIEDVIADMVESGELEAGEEFEAEDEEVEGDEEIEVEDETEMAMEGEEEMEEVVNEEEEVEEAKDEDDMKEIMAEIDALKAELNEVNLLNAKLLYVNKIFRSKNLTESQKSKVVTAFDKAGSVNEVKLVFETLSESMIAKKEVVKENLGRASKAAGVAPTKQPIVEVDSQVARWQKLAGIK